MPEGLADFLLDAAVLAVIAYPAGFSALAPVSPRSVFAAASYGLPILVGLMIMGLLLPLHALDVYMVPQLRESGYFEPFEGLYPAVELVLEYAWVVAAVVYLVAPPLLYIRFGKKGKLLHRRLAEPNERGSA